MTDKIAQAIEYANSKNLSVTLIQVRNLSKMDYPWRCLVSHHGDKGMASYGHDFGYGDTAVSAIKRAVKNFQQEHPHIYYKPKRKRERLRRERL